MIFTLDTNVLFYSVDPLNPDKRIVARMLITRMLACECVLTIQALGEFLSAVRRKNMVAYPEAQALVREWSRLFALVGTNADHLLNAAALADRYKLQFWDSLIIAAARSAGVESMFTEDMQDGQVIDGLTLINPFAPANKDRIEALFAA